MFDSPRDQRLSLAASATKALLAVDARFWDALAKAKEDPSLGSFDVIDDEGADITCLGLPMSVTTRFVNSEPSGLPDRIELVFALPGSEGGTIARLLYLQPNGSITKDLMGKDPLCMMGNPDLKHHVLLELAEFMLSTTFTPSVVGEKSANPR